MLTVSSSTERSQALIGRLQAMPRLVLPVAALVLLLVGLMAPLRFAVPALVLLIVLVAWLASLSWYALDSRGRVFRVLVVGVMTAGLVARVVASLTAR